MIDWAASEFVAVIAYLFPGFLAAWVFFGLTAHPRRDHFERLVQAVIFTGFVHALNYGVEWSLHKATAYVTLGAWTGQVAACWSVGNAIFLGLLFSVLANYGWLHWILQKLKITKRTSFPSEWFSAFNRDRRYVVLHLKGDRRIRGWPEEWPDSGDCGHFVLCNASWLLDDNEMVPIHAVDQLVIPVSTVEMVERMKDEKEMTAPPESVLAAERKLASLYKTKEPENGEQSTRPMSDPQGTAAGATGANGKATVAIHPAVASTPATPTATTQKLTKRERKQLRKRG